MAMEDALVFALVELPIQGLALVMRRCFAVSAKRAYTFAGCLFFALILGGCLLAWFWWQP